MSEFDGLEEIDLTPHGSARTPRRMRNARKQLSKARARSSQWKSRLRAYQTKKANKVEK